MDKQLVNTILQTKPTPISGSKDGVQIYTYNNKKYFVRKYDSEKVELNLFNRLLSFELFKQMGILIPNFSIIKDGASHTSDADFFYLLSEDCEGKPLGGVDIYNSSIDQKYHQQLAKIIYVADLFNFSDLAKDNIFVSSNEDLIVIDFDLPKVNHLFPPQNVFKEPYNLAKSLDMHTTKGQWRLMNQVSMKDEAESSIDLTKEEKQIIEAQFFKINSEFLNNLINITKEKYFKECKLSNEIIEDYKNAILQRVIEVVKQKQEVEQINIHNTIKLEFQESIYISPTSRSLQHSETNLEDGMLKTKKRTVKLNDSQVGGIFTQNNSNRSCEKVNSSNSDENSDNSDNIMLNFLMSQNESSEKDSTKCNRQNEYRGLIFE